MKNGLSTSLKAGNGTLEGIVILAVILVIILITPKGVPGPTTPSANFSGNTNAGVKNIAAPNSSYARYVSLGIGNASYAYQPYEEYVTIDNVSGNTVNITNWQLKNGKDKRGYYLGGELRYFPADTATIGQATPFISPSGRNVFQDVMLKPGENAVITTGSVGSQSPYKIISFKENICSGFLEDMTEYAFTPSLARNCKRPADEPGVSALDTECRNFIEGLASCRTPEFNTRDVEGNVCQNCIDGKLLSGSCVAFIKGHFNYTSCIAYHQNDSDFSGRTWRVFLGRGWEMWAEKYETMSLFDQLGRLVDYRAY